MTWVVSDYTATPGTSEVSVTKGQQVEVLDTTSSSSVNAEFCLVRLSPIGGGDGGTQEGLVPIAVLKPPPPTKGLLRRGKDAADMDHPTTAAADSNGEYIICFFTILNFELFRILNGLLSKWFNPINGGNNFKFSVACKMLSQSRQ